MRSCMEMGRNTGVGKKGYNSGTLYDIVIILFTKYSGGHRESPHKFNFPNFQFFRYF
jgi:hypothetical protein